MSDILIKPGPSIGLTYNEIAPWRIDFDEVDDIILPFDGTIVLPDVAGAQPNFDTLSHQQFLFLSLKYPVIGTDGARRFPTLRDMRNRPFETDKDIIIFVANDTSFLDDIHLSGLSESSVYDPAIKDNMVMSSRAKYIVFEFDSGEFPTEQLPTDLKPYDASKGLHLKLNTLSDPGWIIIKSVITSAGLLSGRISVFDISGMQTEAYSSLLQLGIPEAEIEIESGLSPLGGDNIKVQFVNIHGEPLAVTDFPLANIEISPTPVSLENDFVYELPLEKKIGFKVQAPALPDEVPPEIAHRYYFHYVSIWPGYNYQFKEVTSNTEATEIDFNLSIDPAQILPLRFVRICVFHPTDEFQNYVDDHVKPLTWNEGSGQPDQRRAVFVNNHFYLYSARNKITVYNSGDIFFKEYHEIVSSLAEGDKVYQANWESQPIVHLKGSMNVKGIHPNNLDADSIFAQLEKTKINFTLFRLTRFPTPTQQEIWAIYFPETLGGNSFTESLVTEVWSVPDPAIKPVLTNKGFIRKEHSFAWLLKTDDAAVLPIEHRVKAHWKDDAGKVQTVSLTNLIGDTEPAIIFRNIPFPIDRFEFGIDDNAPAGVQLKRTTTVSDISTASDVCLMLVNLSAGGIYFLPLYPPGTSTGDVNVIISDPALYEADSFIFNSITQFIETFTVSDKLLLALSHTPEGSDDTIESLVISDFVDWRYSLEAIRLGIIPLHDQELGGLFRKVIDNGVEVRALYWEQFLASIKGGESLAAGFSNNESITNVINRTGPSGKRGFALRDKSAREFGSWHQKSSVVIKKEDGLDMNSKRALIGYVGGMDLALGRWDTQEHFDADPERQTGLWYDIHVKIEGEGALDLLKNFGHRWKAMESFYLDSVVSEYMPVDNSPALRADVAAVFDLPEQGQIKLPGKDDCNAFVQINRTIPPRSSLSMPVVMSRAILNGESVIVPPTGELGSLQSYEKAFASSKKFILINEQYFFSQELALALHNRLAVSDGPEFLILCLPLNLSESEYIDPHLFRVRKLAIETLYYGSRVVNPMATTPCGRTTPNGPTSPSVKHKVAIINPINGEGKPVYVHSKHILVDDVWMSIGSANVGNRSLTFDGEINAAIVGNALYKGGTAVVRNHRIEICRQLLGLPEAYSAMLQDPYATFRLFKAVEQQQDGNSFRLHPHHLHFKWVDPSYAKKTGDVDMDNQIDFVMGLDYSNPFFAYLTCNGLDPDGRNNQTTRLGYIAALFGLGKFAPTAMAEVGFDWGTSEVAIRQRIIDGFELVLKVEVTMEVISDEETKILGPFTANSYNLKISSGNIVFEGLATVSAPVAISVRDKVIIAAFIYEKDSPTVYLHDVVSPTIFDPPADPFVVHGSTHAATLIMKPKV